MTILSMSWGFPGALPSCNHVSSFHIESRDINNIGIKVLHTFTRRRTQGCSSSHRSFTLACLGNGVNGITDIIHNKVLIAACLSATIGQLSKPFTSTIFYGHDFDIRTAFQAGGFPSTHSSTAVAAATSIGLERGFSDALFGLAVVYAGLVIYDAQGVRREVGNHAKVLNRILLKKSSSNSSGAYNLQETSKSNIQPCLPEELNSLEPSKNAGTLFFTSSAEDESKLLKFSQLKESIGHSEIEVIAGALLGFLVSLALLME